jgi:hypothetical protein
MQIFRGDGIGKCGGTLMEEEWVVPKISAPLDCLKLALISRMPCSKGVIICKALAFFSYFLMASCLFNQVSHEKKGEK